MVVQAYWPGASAKGRRRAGDRQDRGARLQEVPYSDKIRSYTKPGESLTILQLADWSPGHEVPNTLVPGAQRRSATWRATLPPGVIGPFFNDEFGDVYGSIYALSADGFSDEDLRVGAPRTFRSQLLRVPRRREGGVVRRGRRRRSGSSCRRRRAPPRWASTSNGRHHPAQTAQNAVAGLGRGPTPARRNVQVAGGPAPSSRSTRSARCRSASSTRPRARATSIKAGRRRRRQARLFPIRRTSRVRANGKQVIAIGISMAKGGDIISLGQGPAGAGRRGAQATAGGHGADAGAGTSRRAVHPLGGANSCAVPDRGPSSSCCWSAS